MSEPSPDKWRATISARLLVGSAIFVLWAGGIQARLLYLQVHRHADLQSRAENQSARTMDISAKRGDILDRRGRVLAYSVDADSVYGVPSEIENAERAASALCAALTDCAPKEQDALAGRLRQKRAFVYVRRRVTPPQARRIAELNLEGIGFIKEDRRFYPKKQLAAQLLGFVGVDNKGLAGIEAAYDSQISGALGKLLYQTDARGPRVQPSRAASDHRRDGRADDRRISAAHRRARAPRCRRPKPRCRRHRADHGAEDR